MRPIIAIFFAAAALLVMPEAEAAFRCDGQIVETGDSRLRVRSLCGEPDLVDAAGHYYLGHAVAADSETWYYNFGPRQLIRVLRFRRGSLIDIDQDGYGFRSTGEGRCGSFDVVEGLSKFRLIVQCGQPDDTEIARVLRPVGPRDYRGYGAHLKGHRVEVVRERWIYNFGPDQLLRIAWIENGRVVDVEVGERGYRSQ